MAALFFFPIVSVQTEEYRDSPTGISIDSQYSYSFDERFVGPSPVTLEGLINNKRQFNNYDEFLVYLKRVLPELFERPIFLHHTGSLQRASFEEPRVLLFGRGIVLAFDNTTKVEMMEFDLDEGRFRMGEISFHNRDIKIEIDPPKCLSCHGNNPNPIWNPYNIWIKAFRSQVDWGSPQEQEYYQRFRDRENKTGIYKYVEIKSPEFPDNSIEHYTQFLSMLNFLRMMSLLKQNDTLIRPFRYVLAAIINGCTSTVNMYRVGRIYKIEEFLPPHVIPLMEIPKRHYDEDGRRASRRLVSHLEESYGRMFGITKFYHHLHLFLSQDHRLVTDLRYILENLGLPWREFTMGHGENDYAITSPYFTHFDLMNAFISYAPDIFVELKPSFISIKELPYDYSSVIFSCDDLKERSLEELQDFQGNNITPVYTYHADSEIALAPMSRCIKCHGVEDKGPDIPLGDAMALRVWLDRDKNRATIISTIEEGTMPRKSQLTGEQREALIEAIEELK